VAEGAETAGQPGKEKKRVDLRYTQTRRRKFITELATSYDPEAACEEAGLDWPTVCRLRVLHPEFAAEWDEVIAAGYDRLELLLLRQAGAGREAASGKSEHELAAALLKQRRALKIDKQMGVRSAGAAAAAGRRRGARSQEQMLRAVKEQLEPLRAIAAARGSSADGEAGGPGGNRPGLGEAGRDAAGEPPPLDGL